MDTVQTIDKLKEVLTPIADKIGQTAEWGWEVVVKQQYVTAYLGMFWGILGLLVLIGGVSLFIWRIKNDADDEGGGLFALALLLTILGGLPFVIEITTAITHLINPEFYAIEFFINLVR